MAVVLILLLLALFTGDPVYWKVAIAVLVLDMIMPRIFYPFAVFWYSLAKILGTIISRILITVIYLIVLLPVALVRQMSGRDPLQVSMWKKGNGSVMKVRNHLYTAADIEKPY